MLKRTFDAQKPHRYVCYRRMSSDQQNPRSPQQQGDTIAGTLKGMGHPWVHVGDYTDAGISGRYVAKRPDLQRMLRDIRAGTCAVDLILVDTYERFGRAEELEAVRRELDQKYGVLILTADTHFGDPTTPAGKALAMVESMRATEDTRIKAHTVLRGKRDAARLGHWPGGRAPFGYQLKSILVEHGGVVEVGHRILVPHPENAAIIQRLFATALERSWGSTKLTRMLNEDPNIPDRLKPFSDQNVNWWMKNPIYYGELVWEKNCTGIVDDRKVLQRHVPEDMLRVPTFCEPIVTRETWDAVQTLRRKRSECTTLARARKKIGNEKQIIALAPGLALKYLLSGLVRCALCNRVMVASGSATYTTKAGVENRYVSYTCPGYITRTCPNAIRVPEAWLREAVMDLMRERLFPRSKGA